MATPVPAPTSTTTGGLPGNLAVLPGTLSSAPYGATATVMGPGGRGINTALIASPDAGPRPVFADTGGYALPIEPIAGPALVMTPREQIAPIGSEVVLIASYLGNKDRLITNEKVEWALEGVGSILKFDEGSVCDPLHCDFVRAKKVSERFAITKTSQLYQTLDRGTADTSDDIHLLKGQTWISINSMREGTTHVTGFAPSMKDWSKRTDFGIVHWVDAQWVLPTLPIAQVGDQRVLTTVVLRQSNGQPRAGWIVQYELLNGPAGGFSDPRSPIIGGSLAQRIEVPTDLSGRASVTLSQLSPVSGTNTIAVQIIRPAGVDGSDRRVTVGNETIRQTWAGNPGVTVRMIGPASISKGQEIPYTITASNLSASTASGVVSLVVPTTAAFVRAEPPPSSIQPQSQETILQWNTTVPANGISTINLFLRQDTAGELRLSNPVFYSQAVAAPSTGATTFTPSATVTPVPTVSPPSATTYTPPAAVTPVPSIPPPPSNLAGSIGAGSAGASTFAKMQVSAAKVGTAPVGSPCKIAVVVENAGNAEARNVVLQIKLPPEYKDRSAAGLRRIESEGDMEANAATFIISSPPIPLLFVGQKKEYVIVIPNIPKEGYTMACSVLVDGRVVGESSARILPD